MNTEPTQRLPLPPLRSGSARLKVRLAEDGWNSRDPEKVALAYTLDSYWRNRVEFIVSRPAIAQFLTRRKWSKELDYRLIKELWGFRENRMAVRFAYEWRDDAGNWFRSYGNENWEFDQSGFMARRFASINDLPIKESERKFHWPLGASSRQPSKPVRACLVASSLPTKKPRGSLHAAQIYFPLTATATQPHWHPASPPLSAPRLARSALRPYPG